MQRPRGLSLVRYKEAVKFAEHIYSEVIEDVPHRHTVFTIPKGIRSFFKYDR